MQNHYFQAYGTRYVYNPKPFPVKDTDRLVDFARKHNFGFLFSMSNGVPSVAAIPMLIDDNFRSIRGHLALANGIWKGLDGKEALVVFPGPNHYISPVWYGEDHAVPTWNYVAVNATGRFKVLMDPMKKTEILDDLTLHHEKHLGGEWAADWGDEKYNGMLNAIIAFEIEVSNVEGKWKLSQNHPRDKCSNVSRNLRQLKTPQSLEIADLMDSVWE